MPRSRCSHLDATGCTTSSLQPVDMCESSKDLGSDRVKQVEDGEMRVGTNDRFTDDDLDIDVAGEQSMSANLPCVGSDMSETSTGGSPQGCEMDTTARNPLDSDTATAAPHTYDSTSCQTMILEAMTTAPYKTNTSLSQPLDSDAMSPAPYKAAPYKADTTSCQTRLPDAVHAAPHQTNTSSSSPMDTDTTVPHMTDALKADETAGGGMEPEVGFKLPGDISSRNTCTTDRGKYS